MHFLHKCSWNVENDGISYFATSIKRQLCFHLPGRPFSHQISMSISFDISCNVLHLCPRLRRIFWCVPSFCFFFFADFLRTVPQLFGVDAGINGFQGAVKQKVANTGRSALNPTKMLGLCIFLQTASRGFPWLPVASRGFPLLPVVFPLLNLC